MAEPARPPASRFGAALARARSALSGRVAASGPELAFLAAPAALARHRRLSDQTHTALRERRDVAEPARDAASPRLEPRPAPATSVRPPEVAPALLPPRALDQVALAAQRLGDRPAVELTFGRDLRVSLLRGERGVEVVLTPAVGLRRAADAELPGLVAALRAGGVAVTRAEVRTVNEPPGRALTPQRASATTARTLDPDGTVAKW
jgi:hypothetical protein